MEMFELRYFLGAAAQENLHHAAVKLHVSPAALSKAISRLENELSLKLFVREGRNIKLTEHGRVLQKRASEIINLEESAKVELIGHKGTVQVVMAGPEILLSHSGLAIAQELKKLHPLFRLEFLATDDETALEKMGRGEAHLALTTSNPGLKPGQKMKIISEVNFQTFVGPTHALSKLAKAKKQVSVHKVLEHSFASPNNPLLGKVGLKQSLDGWRDDQFPRRVDYLASSLKTLEELVAQGMALAYLPDYYGAKLGFLALNIHDCPYSCRQKIKLVANNPNDLGWLKHFFD